MRDQRPGMNPRALGLALTYSVILWALMYGCYRLGFQ